VHYDGGCRPHTPVRHQRERVKVFLGPRFKRGAHGRCLRQVCRSAVCGADGDHTLLPHPDLGKAVRRVVAPVCRDRVCVGYNVWFESGWLENTSNTSTPNAEAIGVPTGAKGRTVLPPSRACVVVWGWCAGGAGVPLLDRTGRYAGEGAGRTDGDPTGSFLTTREDRVQRVNVKWKSSGNWNWNSLWMKYRKKLPTYRKTFTTKRTANRLNRVGGGLCGPQGPHRPLDTR